MDSSQNGQENKKKRSGWVVVLIILLVLLLICCLIGGILCWGTQRVPDVINWMYENAENYGFDEEELEQLFRDFEGGDFEDFIPDELESFEEFQPGGEAAACQNLSGTLEVELLVGPADAAGLEPVSIGEIPFVVGGEGEIAGSTYLDFEDVLEAEWGTFTVYFDGDVFLTGLCREESGGGVLDLTVEFVGDQLIAVDTGGEVQEYPWSGSADVDVSLPVQDGAREAGEGWAFILRLD